MSFNGTHTVIWALFLLMATPVYAPRYLLHERMMNNIEARHKVKMARITGSSTGTSSSFISSSGLGSSSLTTRSSGSTITYTFRSSTGSGFTTTKELKWDDDDDLFGIKKSTPVSTTRSTPTSVDDLFGVSSTTRSTFTPKPTPPRKKYKDSDTIVELKFSKQIGKNDSWAAVCSMVHQKMRKVAVSPDELRKKYTEGRDEWFSLPQILEEWGMFSALTHLTASEIREELREGRPIIALVKGVDWGQYVVIFGISENDQLFILNPAKGEEVIQTLDGYLNSIQVFYFTLK